MIDRQPTRYKFGDFEFDPNRLALYHAGDLLKIEKKALELLAVLIETPNELVSTQEIIERVWQDNRIGVTSTHLAQSVSKLRKAFAAVQPGTLFVETVKGRGLVFHADIEAYPVDNGPVTDERVTMELAAEPVAAVVQSRRFSNSSVAAGLSFLIIAGLIVVAALTFFPTDEEHEIRKVVEESQKYESLVLYRNPESIDESKIKEYWLGEQEFGAEVDIRRIRAGIDRLKRDGKRYGPETKNEQFEFQFVEINKDRDFATVKTLERWFITEYQTDGTLIRNKTVGPYFVHYILRKVDGQWKIERSSTARASLPPPIIESIRLITEPVAGREFYVSIAGRSISPDQVFIKVIGPGCPQVSPCIVPNSALRIHSKLSETSIEKVPLTLASGEFTIYAQNGESNPSNSITLTVP
ncbi:MAG: winged helix-turn-helix domain-containing protein [Chloracidobacterium sp.]|nr:winged helix-turn-helix domain-containing protein [Chloracidobacterium sp.]